MPSHRAYYATADEARTAASAAVERLNAAWQKAASEAGDEVAGTAPVVQVRIEGVTPVAAPPGVDLGAAATVRLTGPNGRREVATITMPTAQSDVLLDKASGSVKFNRNGSGVAYTTMRSRSRIATSIQVTVTAACTLTGLVVQDRFTGKKYTCGASTPSSAGVHTVPVTETSSSDLNDVTFGTVVEFLAPPPEANPIARVNGMAGWTTVFDAGLTDSAGRKYLCKTAGVVASAVGLTGDLHSDDRVVRDPTDTNTDDTPLAVGDVLTWNATPANARSTVEIVSVADEGEGTFLKGSGVTAGASSHPYLVTENTSFGEYEQIDVPILSVGRGGTYDLTIGNGATHTATGAIGTVATAIPAASFPERYPSQVIGAAMTWSSRVYPGTDGRWVAEVFTVPDGS